MNTRENLYKKDIEKMFYRLCVAMSEMKNAQEAAELLRDLLSYSEVKMVAKRLEIAEMVLAGKTYDEIREELKVGYGKIARVQEWLNMSGEGYRKAVKKIRSKTGKDKDREFETYHWSVLKRKYPMYYWPELLIETIIKSANERQRKKIESVIKELDKTKIKTALHRRIANLLTRK
jgi:TrpR-related protein YerC/YecD